MADPRFPSAKEVELFHTNSDKDGSPTSIHHTLGIGPNQASPGDHTHDGGTSKELSDSVTNQWADLALSGGWANFAGGHQHAQYRKIGDTVELRGLIKHATTTTLGTFATLPAGFWPPLTTIFVGHCSNGVCDLRVNNAGQISVALYIVGNGASVSLATIRFSVTA